MAKYQRMDDYEPSQIDPSKEVLKFACCDCGLVHTMAMSIISDGQSAGSKIEITWRRENRSTAQLRRNEFGGLHTKPRRSWHMTRVR